MNAVSPPPAPDDAAPAPRPPSPAFARPRVSRADAEFLPAALEVLEQPASPIAMAFLLTICAFAFAALAWAWLGWTDIVAVAHGKLQPTGRVKVVQPLETGRVRAIAAQNGASVQEGDVLVELDPDDSVADARAAEAAFASWRAEALRRDDVIAQASAQLRAPAAAAWPDFVPAPTRAREDAVRRADLRNLAGQLASLDARAAQKRSERQRMVYTIAAQEALIGTLQERVTMRATLLGANAGTRSGVIDATESLHYQRMVLAGQQGQLAEAERAIEAIQAERDRTLSAFLADNTTRMAEAQRQAEEAEQRWARARLKVERMTLRSPAAGVVQASSVTSLGQVLAAGQEVMRVVPRDAALEIEVYLENKDIGFVAVGQEASIKVEAFPFTRYGVLEARVTRVAKDAIPEPDARQIEGDPSRSADNRSSTGAERVRSLVFPVVLTPSATHVMADGRAAPLSPGMAVSAEIKTGQRRILEYLLSPLAATTSEALRER
ncbi:HlyD family type I secretion periplasmic adaptor subunit [Alsobacter sp. KACC 23698]|uniref:Membrane fusion protein (MFP) family protein n=1 Tax=Alsobacter sp. KACC 23698 TaxID=3149229 RepID=A0AAU7JFF3_9HYPH